MSTKKTTDRLVVVAVGHEIYPPENGKSGSVAVTLRVIEGDRAGEEVKYFGSLHENSQQYTAEALRLMGWSCNDITVLDGLGKTKVVAIEKEEVYNGRPRKSYQIWPAEGKATLADNDRESFAKQFKALAASVAIPKLSEKSAAPAELPPAKARATANGAVDGPAMDGPQSF